MESLPTVEVFVEIPSGSRNKYEYDEERKVFRLDRMLFSSMHYPADYGYIPGTLAEDGDCLDALVLLWEPTFPGCLIEARPIGLFNMRDEKGPDQKILCVPLKDPQWNHLYELSQVPPHILREIDHFFSVYKDLEHKKVTVEGWDCQNAALRTIEECRARYNDKMANSTL